MTDLTSDVSAQKGHRRTIVAVVIGICLIIVGAAVIGGLYLYNNNYHRAVSPASQPCDADNHVYYPKKIYVIDATLNSNAPFVQADNRVLTDPHVAQWASCAELYSSSGNEEKVYLPDNLSPQAQYLATKSLYSAIKRSGYYSNVVLITPPQIIKK